MADADKSAPPPPSLIEGWQLSGLLWRQGDGDELPKLANCVIPAAVAWLPLLVLSVFEGTALRSVQLPFLHDYVSYARMLVAIPLLVIAMRPVDIRIGYVVRYLGTSGIVGIEQRSAWEAALGSLTRAGNSKLATPVMVAVALAVSLVAVGDRGHFGTVSSSWHTGPNGDLMLAGWFYAVVSLPLYLVLIYRWAWRGLLWLLFLWRISRIPLHLQPTHPDSCGGLGILWRGQIGFLAVALAVATSVAGNLAHEIVYENSSFTAERLSILGCVLSGLLTLFGPLIFFTRQLAKAKAGALVEYSELGDTQSDDFRAKWITNPGKARLLESADPSAIADYAGVYQAVSNMRIIPLSRRGLLTAAVVLFLPFSLLPLLEMPILEVLDKLLSALR